MNQSTVRIQPRLVELSLFAAALIAANCMLLIGRVCTSLIFLPAPALSGDWWRWITFPLVHVSGYHLLMDAGAFLFLYHSLQETSALRRLLLVAACSAGSLTAALLTSPLTGGLCGLSGIAHGLMAVSAIEFMRNSDRTLKQTGILCFAIVVLKSIYEAISGHVFFEALHFGQVASPVAASHAGGVLGGLFTTCASCFFIHIRKQLICLKR